ncbi:MAG TPA: MarR family transcriptional regulator [Bacteroidales bacterium]|nr:MarR family transcriptional regulator [Bacteroidales bacterium]
MKKYPAIVIHSFKENVMKKEEILKELIDKLFEFSRNRKGTDDYSMDEFVGYLNARSGYGDISMRKISGQEFDFRTEGYSSTLSDISILLALMYRYAKSYIKKALRRSPFQTADEFSYLITLMTYDSLTKSELINKQVMEKTSGTEVIKRLISRGFISEFSDSLDKRSKRISITGKGRKAILDILPAMNTVSGIIAGNLTKDEVNTLAYLLKKLDYFHNDIYTHRHNEANEDIYSDISHKSLKGS